MNFISVTDLKGVGSKNAELLANLNILTAQDLLFHLPVRYEDRTRIKPISQLKAGDRVLIEGTVYATKMVGAKNILRATLVDESRSSVDLVFFHFTQGHQKKLSTPHLRVRCFGEVRQNFSGQLEITHPEYAPAALVTTDSFLSPTDLLSPIYPTTKGLAQKTLRKLIQQSLQLLTQQTLLTELLPEALLAKYSFCSLSEALQFIHFPPKDINQTQLLLNRHPMQSRLIFEELLAHQLSLQQLRQRVRAQNGIQCDIKFENKNNLSQQLKNNLGFILTHAQQKVISEIQQDLSQTIPMLRLVQGDVGSGKTIVACFAALQAIEAGFQVALMAPTEILAEQHYQQFQHWLTPLDIEVGYLIGKQNTKTQQTVRDNLISGKTKLIIGTHALFQDNIKFKNLALLIIDEQHRFGVQQRLALVEKGLKSGLFPHQLMMTATPIPRTLMMSAYADLDCSVIDELPPGRKPIKTILISQTRRSAVVERVRANCMMKKQAYWICTLIEESEVLQCEAAQITFEKLKHYLPELKIGLVHGRLSSEEKNNIMQQYKAGEIDLLVATTVVEVGVDVPNASLMIIENPERLGLAQLHQLRGRVGRGADASFCVLLFQSPLSITAKKRLSLMRETQDGFEIAKQDLAMRGAGEILGTRQSGLLQMRVADIERDQDLLPMVQEASRLLLIEAPQVVNLLMQRWIGAQIKYFNA